MNPKSVGIIHFVLEDPQASDYMCLHLTSQLTTEESSSDLIDILLEDCGQRSTFVSLAVTKQIFRKFQKEVTLDQVWVHIPPVVRLSCCSSIK